MAIPVEEENELLNSPDTTTARADFETAQYRVFEGAGVDTRSRFIDLENTPVRIHIIEAGDLDSDEPPLVFVHGGGWFGAVFAPLIAQLDDRRLIVIDRPGCGLSGDFVYTANDHRRTVRAVLVGVLDELGIEQADLVGNSTGGYWSIVFALTRPHRVRRLILIGGVPTFPGTRPPVPVRLFTVPVLNRLLVRLQEPSEEGVVKQMKMAGEGETIQRYPALIRARIAHDRIPRTITEKFSEFESVLTVRGWRAATRIREEELRELQRPTLFIWGENDFLGDPDDVREGVGMIPDAQLAAMDAGHIPWLGHPKECSQLIREMRG